MEFAYSPVLAHSDVLFTQRPELPPPSTPPQCTLTNRAGTLWLGLRKNKRVQSNSEQVNFVRVRLRLAYFLFVLMPYMSLKLSEPCIS